MNRRLHMSHVALIVLHKAPERAHSLLSHEKTELNTWIQIALDEGLGGPASTLIQMLSDIEMALHILDVHIGRDVPTARMKSGLGEGLTTDPPALALLKNALYAKKASMKLPDPTDIESLFDY